MQSFIAHYFNLPNYIVSGGKRQVDNYFTPPHHDPTPPSLPPHSSPMRR